MSKPIGAHKRSAAVVVLVVCLFGAILSIAVTNRTERAPSPSRWALDVRLGAQASPSFLNEVDAVACPTVSLCVVGDRSGSVLTSTDPTAPEPKWHRAAVDVGYQVTALACPSAQLCVLGDGGGNLLVSSDPTGGPAAWSTIAASTGRPITAVSCPSSAACVATSGTDIVFSHVPTSTKSWRLVEPAGTNVVATVACSSTALCVAVDSAGRLLRSHNPFAAGARWSVLTPPASIGRLLTATCTPGGFCVAGATTGQAVTISGNRPLWSEDRLATNSSISSIACGGERCVAVDTAGAVFQARATAAPPTTWARVNVLLATEATPMAKGYCSPSLCALVDHSAGLFVSPRGTELQPWRKERMDNMNALDTEICASTTLCLVGDAAGNIYRTVDAESPTPTWDKSFTDPNTWITHISCASSSLCVATDGSGGALISTDPGSPQPTWTRDELDGGRTLWGVSCPSLSFCAAVDGQGGILTTTRPGDATAAWTRMGVVGSTIWEISCPTAALCVAADQAGEIAWSTSPVVGHWHVDDLGVAGLGALDCPTVDLCVAGDGAGRLLTSSQPTGGRTAWTTVFNDQGRWIAGVTCVKIALCVASDDYGNVLQSTDPGHADPAWVRARAGPGAVIWGLACRSATDCIAGDISGHLLSGHINRG